MGILRGVRCQKRCERQASVPDPIRRGTPRLTAGGHFLPSIRSIPCLLLATHCSTDQGRRLPIRRGLQDALSHLHARLHPQRTALLLPPCRRLGPNLPVFFLRFPSLPRPSSPGRLLPMGFLRKSKSKCKCKCKYRRKRDRAARDTRSHVHQATRTTSRCLHLLWTRSPSQEAAATAAVW